MNAPRRTINTHGRSWMYQRWIPGGGGLNPAFAKGVQEFLDFAFSHDEDVRGFTILCPCNKCANRYLSTRDTMLKHLYCHGFAPHYYVWLYHGEGSSPLVSGYDYGRSQDKSAEQGKGRNYGLGSQSRGALHLPGYSGHASSQGSTSSHSELNLRDKKRERQVDEQDAEGERQAEDQEAAGVAAKESRAESGKAETGRLIEAAKIMQEEQLVQQFQLAIRGALVQLKKERERQVEEQDAERKRQAEEQQAARVAAKERRAELLKVGTEQLIEAAESTWWEQLVQQFELGMREAVAQLMKEREMERERQVEEQDAERKRQAAEQEAARVAAKERQWKAETEQLIVASVITKREQLGQQLALTVEEELVQLKIKQRVISEEVEKVEQRQRAKREREDKEREESMSRRVEVEQHPRVKRRRENKKRDELIVRRMVEAVRREMGEPVNSDDDVDPPQLSPT